MTRYATEYGAFCIEQIPNQPQLAHCHSFHIKDEFKGKGLARQLKLEPSLKAELESQVRQELALR